MTNKGGGGLFVCFCLFLQEQSAGVSTVYKLYKLEDTNEQVKHCSCSPEIVIWTVRLV